MEYKYLPKDLATRLTEATADVLNDACVGGGAGISGRGGSALARLVRIAIRTVSCAVPCSV